MKKKSILLFILICIFVIIVFFSFKIFFAPKCNSIINSKKDYIDKDDDVIVLYEKFSNSPYTFLKVYEYEDGNLCINACDSLKNKKLYAIIKTESPFPSILDGTDENVVLLIKDGTDLKLVDLKKRVMETFSIGEILEYRLLVEDDSIEGLIIHSSTENYFYNYKLNKKLYMNEYENLEYIDGYLVAYKDNTFFVLSCENESVLIQIDNVDYEIDKIIDIKYIDDKIHIMYLNNDGQYSYYIFDINNTNIRKILENYEEIALVNDRLYAIDNEVVYIYDFNGTLIKKTYFSENSILLKVLLNYAIILNNNSLNLLNMDNGYKISLFQNMIGLSLTYSEYNEKNSEIVIILSEYDFEYLPKKYEIIYNIDNEEVIINEIEN